MLEINCYVINLAAREDRRKLISSRLGREGLFPIFFSAHDGSECEAAEGFPLKKGELGCFSSHRELLRKISKSDDRIIHLVLEDDAVFAPDFRKRLEAAIASLPENWGLFQAGWLPTAAEKKLIFRIKNRMAALRWVRALLRLLGANIDKQSSLVVSEMPAWGTHCYVVRPWYARKMVACLDAPPFAPIDKYFRFIWQADARGLYRARFPLSGQDWLVGSDVDPERLSWATVQVDENGKMTKPDKRI